MGELSSYAASSCVIKLLVLSDQLSLILRIEKHKIPTMKRLKQRDFCLKMTLINKLTDHSHSNLPSKLGYCYSSAFMCVNCFPCFLVNKL